MKQHSTTSRRTTRHHPRTRAPGLVAGTAAVIVGSLAAAPTDAALGDDIQERRVQSAAAAAGAASANRGGDRTHNGRLAYHAFVGAPVPRRNEIFTIGPRGRGKQRLTHNRTCDMFPAWSPNGRWIVFTACRGRGGTFIMRADGTHTRRLTQGGGYAWSPSGRRIGYACQVGNDSEICTIRRDGTHRRQLSHNNVDDYISDWSSTGRIIFDASDGSDYEIYTIKPNGADRRQLTHNTTDDHSPSFSPSGARIAYKHFGVDNFGDIFIKPVAGGPRRAVTHSPGRFEGGPEWSPNGRRLCYAQEHGGDNIEIYTSRTNGKDKYRVTHTATWEDSCDWGA